MERCETFEIALEKWRCGELSTEEERALEAHLSACASCRAYDSGARSTAAALRASDGSVDWAALRRRMLSRRYLSFAGAVLYVAVLLGLTLSWWLGRVARSSSAYPSLVNLPWDVLAGVALGSILLSREWARAKDTRDAVSPEYLTRLYHADLVGRIRWARQWWMWLLVFGWQVLRPGQSGVWILPAAFFLALTLRERFVVLPRLEREEQEFPFFDDFPHVV